MKKAIFLLFAIWGVVAMSCHDVKVGYLTTENAAYDPDTMVVKHKLYVDSVENPEWDRQYPVAELTYAILGYKSPEECLEIAFGITHYTYSNDYIRWKLDMPWLSTKIQGVLGTQPMYMEIKDVVSESGDEAGAAAMRELLTVRGDGMLILPIDVSSIPVGRYKVSLNIYNEGYSQNVENVFTIIVIEEKKEPIEIPEYDEDEEE